MKLLSIALAMLLLAACGGPEPLPPPSYDKPVLGANGQLSGIIGVDRRHWNLVDEDLRRGIYWHSFLSSLTLDCRRVFPEHADWLGEVNALVRRANDRAIDAALAIEQERLAEIADGADRAIVALNAMRVATVDVPAISQNWLRQATRETIAPDEAMTKVCSLLFDKDDLRDLLRTSSSALKTYLLRVREYRNESYVRQGGLDVLVTRLGRI